ncbi:hypothetical protein [Sphingomonas alba]|uniref:Uncharacterized protein n=1 Tax=Sphingomonas alba TaxID=2908208 RepID=A0ABT0RLG4_9SPHN|nr:hypothetical protein [Sphingomonas alba]MCL6683435.1 hypothetical protein [Sphingomonas alba]
MNEADLDKRLSALLQEPDAAPDPAFVDRVVLAARVDRQIRVARRRAFRRTLIECGAAIAVAGAFYLMSQEQAPLPDGRFSLFGPAMAGLVMLGLWALVTLPTPGYASTAS